MKLQQLHIQKHRSPMIVHACTRSPVLIHPHVVGEQAVWGVHF
jgi:hypothetical protein